MSKFNQLIATLIISITLPFIANAQVGTGKISGKIYNEKNEPLSSVTVKVKDAASGTQSNVDGDYVLTLDAKAGYTIVFTYVGYDEKEVAEVEVKPGEVTTLDVTMNYQTNNTLNDVVVRGTARAARMETINSAIQFQKNTNVVASVVSAEAIRRSPDRNTGEVLKRVPGASIQDGKYLVIRGLADRYNQSMLNGILLSSTEPDRKTFSFDILPSNIIDNIVINKAFIPELPGEWAGGLVQVSTKDVPANDFLSVQIGTGFNTNTIGKDFYTYQGSSTDWLGYDNGFRALPSDLPTKSNFAQLTPGEKTAYADEFKNIWSYEKNNAFFNTQLNKAFGLNFGLNRNIGGNNKLAAVFAVTYNQNNRRLVYQNKVNTVQNNVANESFDYDNTKYSQDVLAGALANFTFQFGNNNKIAIKNLLNVNTTDYATARSGFNYDAGEKIQASELAFKANTFFNTQISGDHNIKSVGVKFHWFGSFNILDQYIPDQRRLEYIQEDPNNPSSGYIANIGSANSSQKSGSRYYGFLSDYNYTAGGDLSYDFNAFGAKQTVKGGYFFQVKDRLFDSRPFSIYLPSDNLGLRRLPPDQVFAAENFGNGTDNKFAFNELSGDVYRYLANSILNAGFIQFDNQFGSKFRVVWGLRVEDFDQLVGSTKKSDPRFVNTKVTDYLPGINMTYKMDNKTNIRFSASQTVIRPEFRELSTFSFYDFDLGASIVGNVGLKRTKVSNLDLRYEIYPKGGELFAVGFFYKYFDKPIEVYFNPSSGGASTYNYLNPDEANSFGAELEFRKKLDFLDALKNFTVQGNFTYIYNRVSRIGNDAERPMQGQSPYLINAGLQYDLQESGFTTTLLFNQIGRRIAFVGGGDQPAVWENPRPLLDLQVAKKIIKGKGELKLNISDIINKRAIFYQDLNNNKKYDSDGPDAFSINRKYGTNFSLTFTYNIK